MCLALPLAGTAQEFSAIAQIEASQSGAQDRFRRAEVILALSRPVPYRVFTLDDPKRLILDFREVDFHGVDTGAFTKSRRISGARFGPLRDGWSRMILDLAAPVQVDAAGMTVEDDSGAAIITLVLRASSDAEFAARAGAPDDPDWAFLMASDPLARPVARDDGPMLVVIDPGHGGLDPGAEHGGLREAEVMLSLALELSDALARLDGIRPALTRGDDIFVPLQDRLTLARAAGADLFISLHADALEGEQATGASVYTLSQVAASAASQRMVERHESGDVLAGLDLTGQGDAVSVVLQDLVRLETAAAGDAFAGHLVQAMRDSGAVLNARPRRQAELAVLNAADFPSVLLEVGFLSNPDDRARLSTQTGRAPIVAAVTLAVSRWAIEQAALAPLMRQ